MPGEPEVAGLLALMLLLDARRGARLRDGELVLLADQDPSLLDADEVTEGRRTLDRALALLGRGPYVMQAAIASLHADEPRDWSQIAGLYGELARLTGSPVVDLNRAIAIAEVEGPGAGLAIVDDLPLTGYRYFHATRGELLSRLGRNDEAVVDYERALELTHDDAERRLLERRLAELDRAGSATIRWVVGVVTPLTRWTLRDGSVRRGVDLLRRQQDDGFVETALSPTVMPSAGQ